MYSSIVQNWSIIFSGAPWVKKSGNLWMQEIWVVSSSTSVRPPEQALGEGEGSAKYL